MRSKFEYVHGKYLSWNYSRYIDERKHSTKSYDSDVYLGNIPSDFDLSECFKLLDAFGRVSEIRLITGKSRFNRNKGYAFVKFYSPIQAEEASIHLDNMEVRNGHYLRAILCRNQRRLMIENIPTDKSDEEIFETLSFQFPNLKDVKSVKPLKRNGGNGKKLNIGFAFVEFNNHRAAVKALRLLNIGVFQFWDRNLNATWMEPDKPHKRVIMTDIPSSFSDQMLYNWIQNSSKDGVVGFEWSERHVQVEFRYNYQAELAMRNLNGITVNGSVIKMYWDVLGN